MLSWVCQLCFFNVFEQEAMCERERRYLIFITLINYKQLVSEQLKFHELLCACPVWLMKLWMKSRV